MARVLRIRRFLEGEYLGPDGAQVPAALLNQLLKLERAIPYHGVRAAVVEPELDETAGKTQIVAVNLYLELVDSPPRVTGVVPSEINQTIGQRSTLVPVGRVTKLEQARIQALHSYADDLVTKLLNAADDELIEFKDFDA